MSHFKLRRTKNLKSPWCVLLLRCLTNANRAGSWPCCTSEAAWSRHHFPSPPSSQYFWFDTQLCSAPCTGAWSCWSFQEFLFYVPAGRRGRKQLYSFLRETDRDGKDRKSKVLKKGEWGCYSEALQGPFKFQVFFLTNRWFFLEFQIIYLENIVLKAYRCLSWLWDLNVKY